MHSPEIAANTKSWIIVYVVCNPEQLQILSHKRSRTAKTTHSSDVRLNPAPVSGRTLSIRPSVVSIEVQLLLVV